MASLYLNQWAGFIARAGYWAGLSISIGAELVASATYLAYWFPSVPALVWVVIFSCLLLLINLAQRWQLRALRILVRHDQGGDHHGFHCAGSGTVAEWPGGAAIHDARRISAQWAAGAACWPLVSRFIRLRGIEFVAITTGESRSATEIPRAIKLTFAILTTVYLGAIVVLVGVMPWNRAGVTESPFVTVFRTAHIPCRNSRHDLRDPYRGAVGSKCGALCCFAGSIFAGADRMGTSGSRPSQRRGISAAGACWRRLTASSSRWCWKNGRRQNAFVSILNASLVGMLLAWLVSLAAHVRFRQRLAPLNSRPCRCAHPSGPGDQCWGLC